MLHRVSPLKMPHRRRHISQEAHNETGDKDAYGEGRGDGHEGTRKDIRRLRDRESLKRVREREKEKEVKTYRK